MARFGRAKWLTAGKETDVASFRGTCGREFSVGAAPVRRGEMHCVFKTRTKWMEPSVLRVPMAAREMQGATRFGDLPSFGARRCIFTAVSPDESVYVTVDHGGVDVSSVDLKLP